VVWSQIQKNGLRCTPKLLDGLSCESKEKNSKRRRSQGALLGSQHFEAKRVCWNFGMGLSKLTSKSLTHTDLHKPNNRLVSAKMEHLWCTDKPRQTWTRNTHDNSDLREATTFPLIVYFVPSMRPAPKCHFASGNPEIPKVGTPKCESRNFQSWDSRNFGGP